MTNYEKILNPTVEEMAKLRTTLIQLVYSTTYRNDVGTFSSNKYKDKTYKIAIQAEIDWLNTKID